MRSIKAATVAGCIMAAVSAAQAQAPLTEHNVSSAMAMAIMQGALEQCTKDGYRVVVTIVDKGGNLAAMIRGDGSNLHSAESSRLKAYTARSRGQTSLEFQQLTQTPEGALLKQIPGMFALGGGVPIKIGNETIGGVGVAGAPKPEYDEVCAKAGIDKVAAQLK